MFIGNEFTVDPAEVVVNMRIKYKQIMVDKSNESREDSFDFMKISSTSGAVSGVAFAITSAIGSSAFLAIGFVASVLSFAFYLAYKYKNYKSLVFSEEAILMSNFEKFARGYSKMDRSLSEVDQKKKGDDGFKLNTDFFFEAFSAMKKGNF